ncbi:MAG: Fe(2+) transporter permease subunit FeoB [Actinomycetia bacterium]|nr:Fe(2+) transporter permease subunit FeoB [Actinomycetes bacterium]
MGCADCGGRLAVAIDDHELTVALGGNPNCGKTALFNALTGVRQRTGNWPGVTVDRKEGRFETNDRRINVVDLPGTYSLDAATLDQQIARDYLLSHDADVLVNVVDASNLERHLYLTVQLLEMNLPLLVALNMVDVAAKRGITIDADELSSALGCPVVPVVAVSGHGTDQLKAQIDITATSHCHCGFSLAHSEPVEEAVAALEPLVAAHADEVDARWLTLKLLENDPWAHDIVGPEVGAAAAAWQVSIEAEAGEEVDIRIADERYSHAHALAQRATRRTSSPAGNLSDRVDRFVLDRFWGVPIFLAVMYAMFMFTINIGGAFIDFFDGVAGAVFVDGFGNALDSIGAGGWPRVLLADGVGGGMQVVATFIPIIAALYLFLSILEDSGYMARAAWVMDRFMRSIGLPGKAFVPMIVGFGCNVPAVMATRTLESERERKLTILMNPFMSCGARLPVYALFAAAFFPRNGQNVVFALYLIGILAAVATGMIMKRSLLSGESEGFMMELPSYHRPTLRDIALHTWDRVRLFVREAGKVIVVMVLALAVLNSVGTDGSLGNGNTDASALSAVGRSISPAFSPMGIEEDNWPATVGIFSGVLAKEVVVGTLDAVYTNLAAQDAGEAIDDESFSFWAAIGDAVATVPTNLREVAGSIADPLGLGVGDVDSTEVAADEQQVSEGTFGAMAARFDGRIGAFAYLLFILLYFPCVATIGAIVREAGRGWALFVALWTSGVAYYVATVFYQGATFSQHPLGSALWIGALTTGAVAVVLGLRVWAGQRDPSAAQNELVGVDR